MAKRVTLTGLALYVAAWFVIAVAYSLAWITDFERGE